MLRKLLNLARANAERPSGIRSDVTGDSASIYVYGIIDPDYGVSAASLMTALQPITAASIDLHVNSPGGDVFEARAMMTALANHPATITAKIDGLAASAASVLALAAATVEIAEGGFYMIHKAWTFGFGNADDLRSTADVLDKLDGSLVADYAAKSGASAEQVVAWMMAETWFGAQEAVDAGFADSIMPTTAAAKANARAFNVDVYDRAPKALTEQQPDDSVRQRMLARLGLYERTAA